MNLVIWDNLINLLGVQNSVYEIPYQVVGRLFHKYSLYHHYSLHGHKFEEQHCTEFLARKDDQVICSHGRIGEMIYNPMMDSDLRLGCKPSQNRNFRNDHFLGFSN